MIKGNKSLIALIVTWVVVVVFGGLYYALEKESKVINEVQISKKDNSLKSNGKFEEVKIYIPDGNVTELIRQNRDIPHYFKKRDKAEAIAKRVFQNLYEISLLKNPNVEINNIYIRDNIMYLDCSDAILELKEPKKANILAIYSLVNSITEIPNIRKIKILVNGKEEKGNFARLYLRNTNI